MRKCFYGKFSSLQMAGAVKVCVALAVVWTASVEGQEDGSFWWLTNTTTAATTATSASGIRCQCVPFFQCVDGVITTSGEGLIDIRFGGTATPPEVNVDVCSDVIQVCCNLPGTGESSHTTPAPTITTTLPPDTPCDCVPLLDCKDPNRLVSDGKGNTSLGLFGSNYSHSKCQGAFEVCCASEATGLPQKEEECVCVTSNLCGDDGYVVTDGEGLINIRHGGGTPSVHHPLPSGECPDVGQVCCKQPPTTTTPILTSTAPPLPDCGWRNVGGVRVSVFVVLVSWMLGPW